jgi:acyl-CoA thioesterase
MTMRVRPDMLNGHGTCHGGMLFALADSCFGYACNGTDRVNVAAGCQIDFLAPAHEGDMLRAEASATARVGRSAVYDVCITNGEGQTVAVFRGKSREIAGSIVQD